MESPSKQLAATIVARLVEEGLLTVERGKKLQTDLPSGDVKGDDWKLAIELSQKADKTEVAK